MHSNQGLIKEGGVASYQNTLNEKSFKGDKFCGLLGSSGMWGKFHDFFHHHVHSNIHGFPTIQNSYKCFNKSFAFLTWILLKTVISILGNGREYITDTCVCRLHTFQDDNAVTGGEELQLSEVSPRWKRSLITSLLACSASYFLISWQKPSRFFASTVEYFVEYFKIFHGVNFQRNKSLAGKTFAV